MQPSSHKRMDVRVDFLQDSADDDQGETPLCVVSIAPPPQSDTNIEPQTPIWERSRPKQRVPRLGIEHTFDGTYWNVLKPR
jgi:hypothetical protein